MSDFIYNAGGDPQAFRIGNFVYDMQGKAIGRVSAERVYRLDGSYVGEMFKNMIVEKPVGARPALPPVAYPGDVAPPSLDTSRVGVAHEFSDVLHRLVQSEAES